MSGGAAARWPGCCPGDPGTARARLFEVLLTLLETLAEQQPVVLVVEDVHWAYRQHLLDGS